MNAAPMNNGSRRGFWRFDRESLLSIIANEGAVPFAIFCQLISNAEWSSTTKEVQPGHVLELRRGDVAFTYRVIAENAGCSPSTVHRRIEKWKKEGRLQEREVEQAAERATGTPERNTRAERSVSVLTICDYERYAFPEQVTGTPGRNTIAEHISGTALETQPGTYEGKSTERIERKKSNSPSIRILFDDSALGSNSDSAFEECWDLYPLKKGKERARKSFKRQIRSTSDVAAFRSALENYKTELQLLERGEQYTKHGSTFFNDGWRDYVAGVWKAPVVTSRLHGQAASAADHQPLGEWRNRV